MADTTVNGATSSDLIDPFTRSVKKGDQYGKDTFLKILTAQLQYQDPMEGGDTTQFISQMAQFTSLEQMQQLNTSFQSLASKQDILTGSMWMGKTAMIESEDGTTASGVVQGFAIDAEAGLLLAINGKMYSINDVIAVKETVATTPETNETGTGTTTGTQTPPAENDPNETNTDGGSD